MANNTTTQQLFFNIVNPPHGENSNEV